MEKVHIKDLEAVVRRSQRSLRLSVLVNQENTIIVKVPLKYSVAYVQRIINHNVDKLYKFVQKSIGQNNQKGKIRFDQKYWVSDYELSFEMHPQADEVFVDVEGEKIVLFYPKNLAYEQIVNESKAIFKNLLKTIFYQKVQNQLDDLAKHNGIVYKAFRLKNVSTIWGSCSFENNITISTKVIFLPKKLQDYVMLHELSHVIHKNHSIRFWNFVSQLCQEDARQLDRQVAASKSAIFDLVI